MVVLLVAEPLCTGCVEATVGERNAKGQRHRRMQAQAIRAALLRFWSTFPKKEACGELEPAHGGWGRSKRHPRGRKLHRALMRGVQLLQFGDNAYRCIAID